MESTICLAIHAEKLHDDRVWQRVKRFTHVIAKKGCSATFFVYPHRAQVAGKNISERLRALAAFGHEIAQHTHFYGGDKIDKPDKTSDFSEVNVVRCLTRDFDVLYGSGFQPKGFTAGGWRINNFVLEGLVDLGFTYDCTARFPKPGIKRSPSNQWLMRPRTYSTERGKIIQIPTTCSLGEFFKWGRRVSMRQVPYRLVYLHDYDLLLFRNYVLLRFFY